MMNYNYLALGDSYTIGEQVVFADNFPNQAVELLRKKGLQFYPAEIIAKTGWTTDELDAAIDAANISKHYDIVSLLIGVNNQYRGVAVKNFKIEFEHLLQRAIQFANNKPNHVFVLSIPDWGVTPFAEGRDRKKIAEEIDGYNFVCETSSKAFQTNFINITTLQRADTNKTEFLAPDGLHPSNKAYSKWAVKLVEAIIKIL